MDIAFSRTPQTPIQLSSTSLRFSSSSSTCLSVARLGLIRRDFLGSGDSTRPPGVRNRRRGWSYGVQYRQKKVAVTSALSSGSVFLGVAVVSVSVAAVVMFDSMQKRKRNEEVQRNSDDLALQHGNEINRGDPLHEKPVLDPEEVKPSLGSENVSEKIAESSLMPQGNEPVPEETVDTEVSKEDKVVSDGESALQSQDLELIPEESVYPEAPAFVASDVLAGDMDDLVHWENPDHADLPVVLPGISNEAMHDLSGIELIHGQVDTHLEEHTVNSRSSTLQLSCVSSAETSRNILDTLQDDHKISETESGKEADIVGNKGHIPSSSRADLYTLFEENKFILNGASRSEGLVALSSNGYSVAPKQFEPSVNGSSHIAEFERNGASFNRSLHKGKDLEDGDKGFARAKTKGLLTFTNGTHVNYDSPAEFYDGYQRLLRIGRLKDCVNLLEEMERKNLLDMDKVYHSRFFQTCRSQKSVIEAFRFVNLISNPTLSTYNMLMSVCASSKDLEGAFHVLQLVRGSGQKPDCKLYTTLISTCAKCGKVDRMFEVFHEMVNAKVEPNVNTYGALIDGCARAGQVPKAFGAYGIMRSKNVKPDRVVFNALITACGQTGAVDRAFDVLAEMGAENIPVVPDHVTVGALIKACANAAQFDRAREVYKMLDKYKIRGNPEVYTIAVNSFSQLGDWGFACNVYKDMKDKGIVPDEMFLSALVDVAGHAENVDAAFEVLKEARMLGIKLGIISYSSLMGACCNAKRWEKALEVYDEIRSLKLKPTVATMNALITALCDGDQLQKAMDVFSDMRKTFHLRPNSVTYAILSVASERGDDLDVGLELLSQAQGDDIVPNLAMFRGLIGMCLRRYEKSYSLGEPVMSSSLRTPQIDNKWTQLALKIYRESITTQTKPSADMVSKVLGCLQLPHDVSLRNRLIENLGVSSESLKPSKLCSLLDGFGEYDPRAFSLFEEAAYLGIVPGVSFKANPIIVDARNLHIHSVEVYILTVLKGLKHRLAAGARLPNINILLPVEKALVQFSKGERSINMATRVSQKVGALLRRLGLPYQGNESYGKIRIYGIATKRWLQPKLAIASPFSGQQTTFNLSEVLLGRKITDQQRDIRSENLSI